MVMVVVRQGRDDGESEVERIMMSHDQMRARTVIPLPFLTFPILFF